MAYGQTLGNILGSIGGHLLLPGYGGTLGGMAGGYLGGLFDSNGNSSSSMNDFFMGKPGGFEQVSSYAPWQQQYFNQLGQMGMQGLQNPYQGFEPIAQQATSQFNQQIVPTLAERFTSMGGSLSSPSFASQLGQAGASLAENLAAQRAQYGLQNRSQFMNLLNMGLTPQYQNVQREATPGILGNFVEQAAPTLGRLGAHGIGAYLNAPQGEGRQAITNALIKVLQGV